MIRCYVTNRHSGDLDASVSRAVADGVDYIQIREKDLSTRELFELASRVRERAAGSSTKVLVNGRLDIAISAGLDGVHLPASGLPPARVRPFVRTLGVSTHNVEEAIQAEQAGADLVVFGPIFDTPGKTSVGIPALRAVTAVVRIPVLAIGGITFANAPEVIAAGAAGIAAIRLFQNR
jgi:thiamine-phosphate pyrophosphorylase